MYLITIETIRFDTGAICLALTKTYLIFVYFFGKFYVDPY